MRYVLDSWALMAWLTRAEPGGRQVRSLLERAVAGRLELFMNIINVGEILYLLLKRGHGERAEALAEDIGSSMPIRTVVPDRDFILDAARLKGRHPISYADAFAAITALRLDCSLVTGDPELQLVSGLKMKWIGK